MLVGPQRVQFAHADDKLAVICRFGLPPIHYAGNANIHGVRPNHDPPRYCSLTEDG